MAKKRQAPGERASLLDKPRVLYAEPGYLSQGLFYGVLLLLGSVGALGCFFGTFQVPVSPWPAVAVGSVCLLFFLVLFLWKRPSWVLSLVGIVLWGAAVWYFFPDLIQGCAHTVNLVLEAYGNKLGTALPQLAADTATLREIQRQCTVFCCLFLFPYLFFLAWVLVGHKSAFGAFCVTGFLACVPMLISLVPPAPFLAVLLGFWAVMLLFSPSFGKRHRLLEDHGSFHATGSGLARPPMLALLLAGAALALAAAYGLAPYSTYERPQIVTDLRNGFADGFGIQEAMRGGVASNNNRVNLSSLGTRTYTGEPALRVKYDWTAAQGGDATSAGATNFQKDYLKSFVGSVYTGTSWESLSRQDQRELEEILEGMHPQTLLDQFSQTFFPDTLEQYQVTVENVGANPRCVYAPYGLMEDSVDQTALSFDQDGFLRSNQFFSGTPQYSLQAWGLTGSLLYYPARVQEAILQGYAASKGVDSSQGDSWYQVDGVEDVISQLTSSLYGGEETQLLENWDLWKIPENLVQYLTPEQQQLTAAVEDYNEYVYEHYTQLPEELKARLQEYLAENHLSTSAYYGPYMDVQLNQYYPINMVAQQIASTLAAQCTYTLTPPTMPKGEDFVEYFLFESHQGYCVHFATAAVALFRAMDIPARYAEGYAVPVVDGEWVDVPDYNAHAWVEIYLGGMGWIPVEVTPAGPDAPAATDDALPMAPIETTPTPTPTPTPAPTATPTPTPSASPEALPSTQPESSLAPAPEGSGPSSGDAPTKALRWLALLGGTALVLALLVCGLLLRRRLVLSLRQRKWDQADPNQAALALYGSLVELRRIAQSRLPGWEEPLPPQLVQLSLKARFSQHTLTPEELDAFQKERSYLATQLQTHLPTLQRLWFQYGRVLF